MDWIRQNTFLATFGGIMLVGFLGLGFFAFSSWKGYSAALDKFESTRTELVSLEGSKLHPDPDNVEKVKGQVDAYEKSVTDLFTQLQAAQQPLPESVDVTKFGKNVQAMNDPFLAKAKGQGMIVGDSFYMGMDRYRNEQPSDDREVLQKLEWQLGGIAELVDLALQAEVDSIDQFRRYSSPWEDPKPAPAATKKPGRGARPPKGKATKTVAMADVSEAARVRIRLTGTPDSISEFFTLVANNKNYHFATHWAKIANETPGGPSRNQDYTPVPVADNLEAAGEEVPEGGAEPRRTDPGEGYDPEEEFSQPMIDVFPILGSERVRAEILIDIVRFRLPPEPEKKTASRP